MAKSRRRAARTRWRKDTGTTYDEPPDALLRGIGHTRDTVREIAAAAHRGEVWALLALAEFHENGLRAENGRVLVRPDQAAAIHYLERAIERGETGAMVSLANLLSARIDRRSLARAAPLYRRAFRRGDVTAAFNLACSCQNVGRYREAVQWYRRAYANGDSSAEMELARAELYGLGTRRNPRAAFAKLERIANGPSEQWPRDSDRIEAILVMANALLTGWPVPRDHDAGMRWLRRAAELGSEVARAML